jgi:hypothetical protein
MFRPDLKQSSMQSATLCNGRLILFYDLELERKMVIRREHFAAVEKLYRTESSD